MGVWLIESPKLIQKVTELIDLDMVNLPSFVNFGPAKGGHFPFGVVDRVAIDVWMGLTNDKELIGHAVV